MTGSEMADRTAGAAAPSPRGYMRESYHLTLDQESLQRNWSLYRQKRHRLYSTLPPQGARLVRWSERVIVQCGSCRRHLGTLSRGAAMTTTGSSRTPTDGRLPRASTLRSSPVRATSIRRGSGLRATYEGRSRTSVAPGAGATWLAMRIGSDAGSRPMVRSCCRLISRTPCPCGVARGVEPARRLKGTSALGPQRPGSFIPCSRIAAISVSRSSTRWPIDPRGPLKSKNPRLSSNS